MSVCLSVAGRLVTFDPCVCAIASMLLRSKLLTCLQLHLFLHLPPLRCFPVLWTWMFVYHLYRNLAISSSPSSSRPFPPSPTTSSIGSHSATEEEEEEEADLGEEEDRGEDHLPDLKSDAGSERGGRRVLASASSIPATTIAIAAKTATLDGGEEQTPHTAGNHGVLVDLDESSIVEPRGPAVMQEVDERDLFGATRTRRLSGGSVDSVDSSMNAFWSASPSTGSNQRLKTIESDSESLAANDQESTAGSSFIIGATKEQISSVLHKLQGRAASYKDKYRDLVKAYNDVVRENDKCRTVLAATQDKALQRISTLRDERRAMAEKLKSANEQIGELREKNSQMTDGSGRREGSAGGAVDERVKRLEELLVKCKETITQKNERIQELNEHVNELKMHADGLKGEDAISELTLDRVTSEWKGRVDRVEEQWTRRLHDVDERHALALAQTKAEMHAALQERDEIAEMARAKCRQLEANESELRGDYTRQIAVLNNAVASLEAERVEMVEKLSQAKQRGVLLVKEEAEQKCSELEISFQKKRDADLAEHEREINGLRAEHAVQLQRMEDDYRNRIRETEQQMQLAMEEGEMKTEADRRSDDQRGAQFEQLIADKQQLEARINQLLSDHRVQLQQLDATNEAGIARHRNEVASLIGEHEEIVARMRGEHETRVSSYESQLCDLRTQLNTANEQFEQAKASAEQSEAQFEIAKRNQQMMLDSAETEASTLRAELAAANADREEMQEKLQLREKEMSELLAEYAVASDQLDAMRRDLTDKTESGEFERSSQEREMSSLQLKLDDKTRQIAELSAENEALTVELDSSRELSRIHEHLREELQAARESGVNSEREVARLQKELNEAVRACQEEKARRERAERELNSERDELRCKLEAASCGGDAGEMLKQEEVQRLATHVDELQLKKEAMAARDMLEQRMQQLNDDAEQDKARNAELQARVEEWEAAVARLTKEKSELTDSVTRISTELEIGRAQRDALERELDACKALLAEQRRIGEARELDCQSLEAIVSEKEEKEGELGERLRQLELRLAEASLQADQLQTTVAAERAANANIKASHESSIDELRRHLAARVAEVEELRKTSSEHETRLVEREQVIAELREQLDGKSSRYQCHLLSLQSDHESRGVELDSLRKQLSGLQSNLLEAEDAAHRKSLEIGDLQAQLDELQGDRISLVDELCAVKAERDALLEAQEEREAREEEEIAELRATVTKLQSECKTLHEEIRAKTEEMDKFTQNDATIREQYARALANARDELSEMAKKLQLATESAGDTAQLQRRINALEADAEIAKQEADKMVLEIRRKAEVKLAKMKKQNETDMQAAKAELLLQLDEMRTRLTERDEAVSELRASLAKAEERLSSEGENERALVELRDTKHAMAEERDRSVRAARQAQSETVEMRNRCETAERLAAERLSQIEASSHLREELQRVQAELLEKSDRIALLEEKDATASECEERNATETRVKMRDLEAARDAATGKCEVLQRTVRELQKEMKQLYEDLNERSQQLELLQKTASQGASSTEQKTGEEQEGATSTPHPRRSRRSSSFDDREAVDQSELQSLRERVQQQQKELAELRERISKETIPSAKTTLANNNATENKNSSRPPSRGEGARSAKRNPYELDEHSSFAEPTEAEYLRNVLFRYMNERETLGRECVTLARVIGTVARFTGDQLQAVIQKEEERNRGWGVVGDSGIIHSVLGNSTHHSGFHR